MCTSPRRPRRWMRFPDITSFSVPTYCCHKRTRSFISPRRVRGLGAQPVNPVRQIARQVVRQALKHSHSNLEGNQSHGHHRNETKRRRCPAFKWMRDWGESQSVSQSVSHPVSQSGRQSGSQAGRPSGSQAGRPSGRQAARRHAPRP